MKSIGIDLGTANSRIFVKGKGIILREPSAVAVSETTEEVLAVGLDASRMAGFISAETRLNTLSQTMVPITLKERWIIAARLAFLLVPKEDSNAVTQVPMFWPMIMGTAAA